MEIDYYTAGPEMEADRVAHAKRTKLMDNDYSDVFTGIGCFQGAVSLQIKDDAMPHQMQTKCVAYALQETYRMELERL